MAMSPAVQSGLRPCEEEEEEEKEEEEIRGKNDKGRSVEVYTTA